jgi:prophage regulatory protein
MSPAAVRVPAAIPARRAPAVEPKALTLHQVLHRVGLGHSKVYELIKAGTFPAPFKVGRVSRWATREVDAWIEDQLTARG